MSKAISILILSSMFYMASMGQKYLNAESLQHIDSIKQLLHTTTTDTGRILIMVRICELYDNEMDSATLYGQEALSLSRKIGFKKGEALALNGLGHSYRLYGDYPKALQTLFLALQVAEFSRDPLVKGYCLTSIGIVYSQLSDNPKALQYFKSARQMFEIAGETSAVYQLEANISRVFRRNGQLDSAIIHTNKAVTYLDGKRESSLESWIMMEAGTLQFELGNHREAFEYLRKCILINERNSDHFYGAFAYNVMAGFYKTLHQTDSAILYAKKALSEADAIGFKYGAVEASNLLAEQYDTIDISKALYYRKIAAKLNDDLYGAKIVQGLQKILLEEQERVRFLEESKIAAQNRLKLYALLAGLVMLLLIAFILFRNYRQQKKSNAALSRTLAELKSAQSQLIHAEKMASLGELTAGIAHEIQNPLNFVNNFSELSRELLVEMDEEADKGNIEEVKAISADIKQNLEKINHHGKRADSIVKGMLQHSQKGSGVKEPTDINALADEYLRLSYHGLRARDNTMNASMITNLDDSIGKIDLVQQDISRVLLNLFNNAFYAAAERYKMEVEGFKPIVTLTTKKNRDHIEITVKDNGTGIPASIKDKIFQPFFTTKPTGQGTGLGLSLSYDIAKSHGGELKVKSEEGEGSSFILILPIS